MPLQCMLYVLSLRPPSLPPSLQMRNLVLSAFPRAMRLPDPFTPNLKVDMLPEISQPPRFVPDPGEWRERAWALAGQPVAQQDYSIAA